MSWHDDAIRLRHMLEHAREAVTLVRGKKRQDLDSERVLPSNLVFTVNLAERNRPMGQTPIGGASAMTLSTAPSGSVSLYCASIASWSP